MNDEKQIMNIFAQAYQLLAKASKQEPSLEGFLQILEVLGEDGILECAKVIDLGPEAVAQMMILIIQLKSALKAANGAKLRYITQLRGMCPDGYLKSGGRCKPCEKAGLLSEGGNVDTKKDWKKEYDKLMTKKQPTDSTKQKPDLFKLEPPKKKLPTSPYDDIRKKSEKRLISKNLGGKNLQYNVTRTNLLGDSQKDAFDRIMGLGNRKIDVSSPDYGPTIKSQNLLPRSNGGASQKLLPKDDKITKSKYYNPIPEIATPPLTPTESPRNIDNITYSRPRYPIGEADSKSSLWLKDFADQVDKLRYINLNPHTQIVEDYEYPEISSNKTQSFADKLFNEQKILNLEAKLREAVDKKLALQQRTLDGIK